MAKRKKNESREALQLPPKVMAMLLAAFAVLAFIGGLTILWQVWRATDSSAAQPQLEALRGELVGTLAAQLDASRMQMQKAISDARLHADAATLHFDDAAEKLR